MALKKMFVLALVLFLAAAVPVSAAPVMSGCSMPMSAGMQPSSDCCPAGACECQFKAAPERHLIGELPSALSPLFIGAGFLNTLLPDFRAPLLATHIPAISASPPPRKLYDLYSDYRI
jgi:hypothetical protein